MRILLLTAMMIFASSAFAGLYKWVDDEGNVHYSQKRPANQQFERLKAPPAAPENETPLFQSNKPADAPNKAVAEETAKNKKIREENCAQAKKSLASYQIYRRVRDKDGNVIILDDKVRATQIKRAKEAISSYCD